MFSMPVPLKIPENPLCPCPRRGAAPPPCAWCPPRAHPAAPVLFALPKSSLFVVFLFPWQCFPSVGSSKVWMGGTPATVVVRVGTGSRIGSREGFGAGFLGLAAADKTFLGSLSLTEPRCLGAVWRTGLGEGCTGGVGWQSLSPLPFSLGAGGICQCLCQE